MLFYFIICGEERTVTTDPQKRKNGTQIILNSVFLKRAADGNRTRDLRTTNATLYRLSHSSNPVRSPHANLGYIIMNIWDCQQIFKKVFKNYKPFMIMSQYTTNELVPDVV